MTDRGAEIQKAVWEAQLKSHGLKVEESVLAAVVDEVPLSGNEIAQAVIELKTASKSKGGLCRDDLVAAARKVLADNVIMARKGAEGVETHHFPRVGPGDLCFPWGPGPQCLPCGPFAPFRRFGGCPPSGPDTCLSCGPFDRSRFSSCNPCSPYNPYQGFNCSVCGPSNDYPSFACMTSGPTRCKLCGPNQQDSPVSFSVVGVPCAPNQGGAGSPFAPCKPCGPYDQGPGSKFYVPCNLCGPGAGAVGAPYAPCTACGPNQGGRPDVCQHWHGMPGCIAMFDPIPFDSKIKELYEQIAKLTSQLKTVEARLG